MVSIRIVNMIKEKKRPRYSRELIAEVERLRAAGKSYSEIRRSHNIPKSTLSIWLGKKYPGVFDRKAQLAHLKNARVKSAKSLQERTKMRILEAQAGAREILTSLPISNIPYLKSLLAMLYWAEGTKFEGVDSMKFVNTDVRLAHLYITLLRKCFPINEARIRIRVHVHYYHDKEKVLKFWSRALKVPLKQFGKIYVKERSTTTKFRRNFMGICFIAYSDVHIFREIMALGPLISASLTSNHPLARNRTWITNSASSRSIH